MKRRLGIGTVAKPLLIILLTAFLVYGCGGGGGGGGTPAGVSYTGLTSQATINETNAVDLAEGAYTGGEIGGALGNFGAVQETGTGRPRYLQITQAIEEVIRRVDVHAPPGVVEAGAIVSESGVIDGTCGTSPGNASYTVQMDDVTGEFSGTMNFNSLCSEGIVISGATSFSGTIRLSDEELLQFRLSFSSLSGTMDGDSFTLEGSIDYNYSPQDTITMEMFLRDNGTGKVYRVNNYVMTMSEGLGYVQFAVSGRFYDPDYGYVDISTYAPFRINVGQDLPSQGELLLAGKNGTKARLKVNSPTTFIVEADTDGDGEYDDFTSDNLNW